MCKKKLKKIIINYTRKCFNDKKKSENIVPSMILSSQKSNALIGVVYG